MGSDSQKNSPTDYQKIWDRCLIEGWHAEAPLWRAIDCFFMDIGKPHDTDKHEFVDLKLERVPEEALYHLDMPIRAIINFDCELLSRVLWAGNDSVEDVLAVIDAFKFKSTIKKQRRETSKHKRKRLKTQANIFSKERSRTPNTHWDKTK